MTSAVAIVASALAAAAVLLAWPRGPALPSTARAGPRSAGGTDGAGRDRAGRRLPVLGGVTAGLGAALFVGGPVGLVAGAVAGVAVAVWLRRLEPASVRRRREAIDEALPLAVDLLASCLAAGQAPAVALQQVTDVVDHPLRDELQEVATRLRLGADPIRVWRDVAAHPQLGSWGRTVLRAVDSGASVADAMAAHADDLRQASRSRVEARARAVGVRAALPLGVCLLPAFVLLGVVPLVAGSLSVVTLP
ncbi:MAG TPA: type II secretion system F family protein [Nocardioides sp.]|jgi:pilus assembly protein TadC|nr:type II secretion system F family protein [uncultured Nocardioides sp.]HEX5986168.1 type II secretion system F family protein [Nocardioides sp.]